MATCFCDGEHVKDCNLFCTEKYRISLDHRFASADTLLRTFQTLSVGNRAANAGSYRIYQFNVNDKLNALLLCGLASRDISVVFDYDN